MNPSESNASPLANKRTTVSAIAPGNRSAINWSPGVVSGRPSGRPGIDPRPGGRSNQGRSTPHRIQKVARQSRPPGVVLGLLPRAQWPETRLDGLGPEHPLGVHLLSEIVKSL